MDAAQKTLEVMAFLFSSQPMAEAVIRAHQRGVWVRVLLDNAFASRGATASWRYVSFHELRRAGIEVRHDDQDAKLNHKVVIIDERVVVTGSFNFSANAAMSNDENMLVLEGEWVGRAFIQEFNRLWEEYEAR